MGISFSLGLLLRIETLETMLGLLLAKTMLLMALSGVSLAFPSDPYAPPHQPVYKEDPIPYNYAYAVNDQYAGTDFGHNEDSDGKAVHGSYTVQLPDGRKQTVNYVADHYNGYQAEVKYYGEAQYPHEYGPPITFKPQGYHPEPVYQPQPTSQ